MRTLLLDADIVAYKIASLSQASHFGGECVTIEDPAVAHEKVDDLIDEYCSTIKKVDKVVICLTCPEGNWRKDLTPTYKQNRAGVVKPHLLKDLKSYLAAEYPSYIRPKLEADDIMGILATHPTLVEGEKIMVSEDKDMRTVPGLLFNPKKPDLGIIEISPLDADRFHMWQTCVGDPVDGYTGCPGVGPSNPFVEDIPFADRAELWDLVLLAYATQGGTEEDAITQARLSHILRATDYDFQAKAPRLWSPLWLL